MERQYPIPEEIALERFKGEIFMTEQGQSLPYRFFKTNPGEEKSRALLVFLHGAGERGTDNRSQLIKQRAPMIFSEEGIQASFPCFMLAPQCPTEEKWVNTDWSQIKGDFKELPAWPLAAVEALVRRLLKENPSIDPGRVVLTGLSMGGFGTFDAMARWPDLFHKALAICGGGDPKVADQIAKRPIWIHHAEDDEVVKVERSRIMANAIEKVGGEMRYIEYPKSRHLGHSSWNEVYCNTPEIFPFLLG